MTHTKRIRAALGAVAVGTTLFACSVDRILAVRDPDIINPSDVNSPAGAEAVRIGALGRLTAATTGSTGDNETMFQLSGLLADEFRSGDSFAERNETDQRSVQNSNGVLDDAARRLFRARLGAQQAIPLLRQYAPTQTGNIAEQFFVLSFVENQAAENFCNGVTFSNAVGATIVNGSPLTDAQAFQLAADDADSALVALGSGGAGTATDYAARVTKARALVNLGQYQAAAALVASVPTSFAYRNTHSLTAGLVNATWEFNNNQKRYVVADTEANIGLNFVSARDPRVPTGAGGRAFDSSTPFVEQALYDQESPMTISSGIEARLMQAEAAINSGGNPAAFKTNIDAERAAQGLGPIVDPVTQQGRIDLLFRERAFSLFATGHRLGDLRRLVRQYTRPAASVFPTGIYFKGGVFGTNTNFPIPQSEQNNPNALGGCLDRNP
ncbi:MAG: RagB/SusD family nutrient uptake outer membrane protein [Gemmatimonadaceae bacterium]